MLKYLIIPLAKDAVSFCHYERSAISGDLISLDILKKAIFWSMKENLTVQFLYPDYEIPTEHKEIIETIDHVKIAGSRCKDCDVKSKADIVAFDGWDSLREFHFETDKSYVVRTNKEELFGCSELLKGLLPKINRLVVVITDVETFEDGDFDRYKAFLDSLIPAVKSEYEAGHNVQLNLLTDRLFLDGMNNCNAGSEAITLAPDGKFYICPAFYLDGAYNVGDLDTGLNIRNHLLYKMDFAPICRNCDAWQCRRCIWLNRKITLEVNTPSREQCVMAHIERNASKKLLDSIRTLGEFLPGKIIDEINYLDPFEIIDRK